MLQVGPETRYTVHVYTWQRLIIFKDNAVQYDSNNVDATLTVISSWDSPFKIKYCCFHLN